MDPALSSPRHVEALLAIPYLLMGASHIAQPAMWRGYFTRLHAEGAPAIVTRTFTLELWPALLHRDFRIRELRLARPDAVLETGPGGKGNWVFGDENANTKLQVRNLWIDGGRLRFFDAPNKTDIDIDVASETAVKPGEGAPILAKGSGRWKGSPFKLEGRGESPLELRNAERPYRIDATATAGTTHAHATGTLLDPLRFRDFDLRLALRGPMASAAVGSSRRSSSCRAREPSASTRASSAARSAGSVPGNSRWSSRART